MHPARIVPFIYRRHSIPPSNSCSRSSNSIYLRTDSVKIILRPILTPTPLPVNFTWQTRSTLRHELALRRLPTEGLGKDFAFRLAISDDAHAFRLLRLPHPTSALPSLSSNKRHHACEDGGLQHTKNRGQKERSQAIIAISHRLVSSVCSVITITAISTGATGIWPGSQLWFKTALLPILLNVFLSCILWRHLPTVDIGHLIKSIDHGYDFVSSKINTWEDYTGSKMNNGYHSGKGTNK